MTPKKIKPVRAWMVRYGDELIFALGVRWQRDYYLSLGERWIRVEIRPVAPKRKRKAKK